MNVSEDSNQFIKEITKRILEVGEPLKIVLFGSHARKTAHRDSDYDFLIVEDSILPRYTRAAKYRRTLKGMRFSKDILVWTPAEIAEWRNVPDAFITTAMNEGIVLYER